MSHSRKRLVSLTYLVGKIREYGFRGSFGMLKARILSNYERFYYPCKQKIVDFYLIPILRKTKQNETLYAFYDLSTSALDYGIVIFLSIAEEERIRLGVKNLCLVVVPETDNELQIEKIKDWRQERIEVIRH